MSGTELKRRPHLRISIHAIIFAILVAIMCVIIFLFSSQNAEMSSLSSGCISDLILRILFPELSQMTPEEQFRVTDTVSTIIRKGAHFTEYAILAQLAFQLFLALPRPRKELTAAALGLVFTVIYAMTDEYHQSFVPGRAMMARDVLIDTLGALLGIFIVLMVLRRQKRKNKAGT